MSCLEEGADAAKVEEEIKTMPNYFADYDTTVHFISEEELKRDHSRIPHGGFVIRTGKTGWEQENQSCDRVQPEAGFQPGIYLQRASWLMPEQLIACTKKARPAAKPYLTSHRLT